MLTFGEKIKAARKEKGLTQRELAELVGAKHNSISNWENNQNKPDPDTIELLLGALNIEPNYLFDISEKEKTPQAEAQGKVIDEFLNLVSTLPKAEQRKWYLRLKAQIEAEKEIERE